MTDISQLDEILQQASPFLRVRLVQDAFRHPASYRGAESSHSSHRISRSNPRLARREQFLRLDIAIQAAFHKRQLPRELKNIEICDRNSREVCLDQAILETPMHYGCGWLSSNGRARLRHLTGLQTVIGLGTVKQSPAVSTVLCLSFTFLQYIRDTLHVSTNVRRTDHLFWDKGF